MSEVRSGRDQLESLRATSTAADGSVFIEIDVAGAIRDLRLADFAMDDGADRLAATIADRHRLAMGSIANTVETMARSNPSALPEPTQHTPQPERADDFGYVPSHLRRG